jgi:hypothetical protein
MDAAAFLEGGATESVADPPHAINPTPIATTQHLNAAQCDLH